MASKSPSELIRDIQLEIASLRATLDAVEALARDVRVAEVRERLAKTETSLNTCQEMIAELRKRCEEIDRRGERLAVVESQLAELKKQFEEKDRRWWQFWVGVGLVGVTFVANLVIQLILLFSRKAG